MQLRTFALSTIACVLLLGSVARADILDTPIPKPAWTKMVGSLQVQRYGSGSPALILVPGLSCGAWLFRDTIARESKTHAVYAVTLAGFDGVPAVRETAVIPKILAPDLDVRFTSGEDSLYRVLASSYGLNESVEEQTLIARRATATEILALELKKGAFVIEVAGVAASSGGTAFDSFEMVFVPHLFAFRLRTTPTADLVSNG